MLKVQGRIFWGILKLTEVKINRRTEAKMKRKWQKKSNSFDQFKILKSMLKS